jgi:hypothetical protein
VIRAPHEFVNADARLDPEGEDAPGIPVNAAVAAYAPRRSCWLREKQEQRTAEAAALRVAEEELPTLAPPPAKGGTQDRATPEDDPQATDG